MGSLEHPWRAYERSPNPSTQRHRIRACEQWEDPQRSSRCSPVSRPAGTAPSESQPSPSSSREPKHSSLGEHTGRQTVNNQQDSTCVLGLVIHWLWRIRETEEGKESRKSPRPWFVQLKRQLWTSSSPRASQVPSFWLPQPAPPTTPS